MATPGPARRELVGWKEIAEYLRLNTRTAQKWESEKGLPVRRYPGEKGRVYAYTDEIESWKEGHGAVNGPRWWRRKFLLAGMALVAGVGVAAVMLLLRPGPPPDYQVWGDNLVALDGRGRQAWTYRLPRSPQAEAYQDANSRSQMAWFGDLDGDSRTEMLFRYTPADSANVGTWLYCLSEDGRLKWQFHPGQRVSTATGGFSDAYRIAAFPASLPGRHVVVTSSHSWSWPNQIVLLSPEGKAVGEYWHSGHLLALGLADVDGDGVDEILAGGVNNSRGRATLVVLDPRRLAGASVQPAGDLTQLQGFAPGAEEMLIYFPRTCITEAGAAPYLQAHEIQATATSVDVFVQQTAPQRDGLYLIYRFDRNLNLLGVTPPDDFAAQHRELERAGKLDHALGPRDFEQWKRIEVIRR